MKKRVFCLPIAAVATLILNAGHVYAWQPDPDTALDPGTLSAIVGQLLAPDPTIGNLDTTVAGVGTDAVGIDDSLTDPPLDPADSSPGTTYFVDNTPNDGDCPPTPFTTIQAGVDVSGPGDTVKVCSGTYLEQVRIQTHAHDGLKLESVVPLQAIIKWPTAETFPLALVDFKQADNVTFRGFLAEGPYPNPGCSPDRHEGLLVENAFNERIHHNHITMIKSIQQPSGCQEGDAVSIGRRSAGGTGTGTEPGSARVDHNQIDDYQKNGLQAVNSGTSAQVDHNAITNSTDAGHRAIIASNGIVVFRNAAATLDHNVISENKFIPLTVGSSGIILELTPAGSRADHNRIFNNDFGIFTAAIGSGLDVSHNDIFTNDLDAVTLCGTDCFGAPTTGVIVRANDIENNGQSGGNGIGLFGANSNLLKTNQVKNNGGAFADTTDGIRVDAGSSNNEILSNQLSGNLTHDCHDDSTGSATAGTANTWQDDHGQTENRPGLCMGATVT